jgi:hypothetical protein
MSAQTTGSRKHCEDIERLSMFDLLKDLWGFMRERKKFWLTPIIAVLLLVGVLVILGELSTVAPFIYTLF